MNDEQYYAAAMDEFEAGDIQASLFSKALVLSDGNEEKAKYKYLRFRAQQLGADPMAEI